MIKDKLKELRKKNHLTQIEFAKIFNISNGTVGNWESGTRQPDHEALVKIAKYFDVTVDYLLGVDEDNKKSPSNDGLAPDEQAVLSMYRMTSPEKRLDFIRQLIDLVPEDQQQELADFVLAVIKTSK